MRDQPTNCRCTLAVVVTDMPGGAANRAGIRYEDLWIVLRIAEMLQGKVTRIRLEPPGQAGAGIELVVDVDGVTWGEQAKSTARNWTINRLVSENVLARAKAQVDLGRCFRLVACSVAEDWAILTERARQCESLVEYEEALGEKRRDCLREVAAAWSVWSEDAWRLLRNMTFEHHSADSLDRIVATTLGLLYADDSGRVLGELRSFCEQRIHRYFTAPEVFAYLEAHGLRRRLIAGDRSVIDSLRRTRERHKRRVERVKPSIGLVPSSDVEAVLGMLRDSDGSQIVVMDGRAGAGKSAIAAGVAEALEQQGWFVAVVRMDTSDPMSTSERLGEAICLTDSPSVLLAGVSAGSPALLVVDQLDAISTYSGRMPDNFDAVDEIVTEIERSANVKVLLVARTVDLEGDPRLRSLLHAADRVARHSVGNLDMEAVTAHLATNGMEPPVSDSTMGLLRTPLHLSVFCQLSESGRVLEYSTLQGLYERYTREARTSANGRVGHLDWDLITGSMVRYMSDQEVLAMPSGVLDPAQPDEVEALVSESVIVRDDKQVAFFHESYFDYLFARAFVAAGRDLRPFLLDSGQHLFRRAQARQVLEHLAATDRRRFIAVVVGLLGCDDIRFHLKGVVGRVLRQTNPVPGDWAALEPFAWSGAPIGSKLLALLSRPGWFDAADSLGRWEVWLDDPQRAEPARCELAVASRQRAARVTELVRPRLAGSEEWRRHVRRMISCSSSRELVELVDLAAEAIEVGLFDDEDGSSGGSVVWMSLDWLEDDDPAGAARLIGALLDRALVRARQDGSSDPFETGHLYSNSRSKSVINNAARKAPAEFVEHVLGFVMDVARADQRHSGGELPVGRRWEHRRLSAIHGVDEIVFSATEHALRALAGQDPAKCADALEPLRAAESSELRFLACRALAAMGDPDGAISWIVTDPRNLMLGWFDSPNWASRELIEECSPACSADLFDTLEAAILGHWPIREAGDSRGHSQYGLLSALDATRMSAAASRRLRELRGRFPDRPPQPAQPDTSVVSGHVQSPIAAGDSEHMSDDDWICALERHTSDEKSWIGGVPVGGARALAGVLGGRAKDEPERFSRLALRFDADIPAVAINAIIRSVEGGVDVDVLTDLCEHAHSVYGPAAGPAVCSAIGRVGAANTRLVALLGVYAADADPEREAARTGALTGGCVYGGDLLTAGLNSTRGQAALAAASVLFASADHVDALLPAVEALTGDDILAVRVCAAEALVALLNHAPERALELAERMFGDDLRVLDARTSERLLACAVLRDPGRFARTLAEAIAGPKDIAARAGRIWAAARWRELLPACVDTDVRALPAAARRGAVEAFASNVADSLDDLCRVLNDDDPEVQQQLGIAIYKLHEVPASELDGLIDALIASSAFPEHTGNLIHGLKRLPAAMPPNTITACEAVVETVGADLANPEKSSALTGRDLITVVLRLYRQGNQDTRVRCLNIIDRLAEFDMYDLESALEDER